MRPGGPRRENLDALQFGLHYGIVCQNQDQDNLNRIKIRLPWLDGGDKDQMHWAQLVTPMEGNKFGWYTLPDVDDVVVVMFIGGDISQPVILGGVWSTPDNSPETNEDGQNNFRGYRSRAGARLLFDDSKSPKVTFSDKSGKNMLGIGNMAKDGAGPNICAIYKPPMAGDKGIALSTVEGKLIKTVKGKLTVKAETIKINAKTTVDIKAGGELKIEASSSLKITAGSDNNCDASKIQIN